MKIYLYSSSVYSFHLFLISSASVRSIPFLSFIVLIFAWNVPLGSLIFFEAISSLSHSVAFLYSFALIIEEGFLISPCYSLELCIQMGISFLFSFAFSFSSFLSYSLGKTPLAFDLLHFVLQGQICLLLQVSLDFLLLHSSTPFQILLLTMMATPFLLRDSWPQ